MSNIKLSDKFEFITNKKYHINKYQRIRKPSKNLERDFQVIESFKRVGCIETQKIYGFSRQRIYQILNKAGIRRQKTEKIERHCVRCDGSFLVVPYSLSKYCSTWCRENKLINLEGQKRCGHCHIYKDTDLFEQGSGNYCLDCSNNRMKNYYSKNRDRLCRMTKEYEKKNPEKREAWNKVAKALKQGKLNYQPCEVCGSENRITAHHDDYSKPLEVKFFCPLHHHRHHKYLKGTIKS